MNLSLALRRARRSWRQLAVLLFAVSLVTAFFALPPLYVRATVQAGLRFTLDSAPPESLTLELINPQPFAPSDWTFITSQLGNLVSSLTRISRSASAFGGFRYLYGEPTTELTPRSEFAFHAYAFSDLESRLRVVEGRLPRRLPPPDSPERQALTEEERIDKGIGMYSTGDVEAVIGVEAARQSGYGVGTRFAIGEFAANRVVVHVVGIVEAADPDDLVWQGNRRALEGEVIQVGLTGRQYQLAFIVTEGAYSDWVAKATQTVRRSENNSYVWLIRLNSAAVTADTLSSVRERLKFVVDKLTADYRGLLSANPLLRELDRYADQVARTEPPIILLAGAVLLLMLYHLVTTVSLYLETQAEEWAALSSRGASVWQLARLQMFTMLTLCAIGAILGAPLAFILLNVLWRISPLGTAQVSAPIAGIPVNAYLLSTLAALAAFVMLSLPALPAARRSLAQFKQLVARPPQRPIWRRYALDIVLTAVGLGFIARLLFFVEGDLGQTLSLLLNEPTALIGQIVDGAARTGGLADPFNLLGAGLLLSGMALLWLRLFPALIRLIGLFSRRSNGLTAPLSVWTVERDPSHYAQLVLLLIGTLALGTAALGLSNTREIGAWSAARAATGGAIRVTLDGREPPDLAAWRALSQVRDATSVLRVESIQQAGTVSYALLGVPLESFRQTFPETAHLLASLQGQDIALQRTFNRQTGRHTETLVAPAIISERLAREVGAAQRTDRQPLRIGDTANVQVLLPNNTRWTVHFRVVSVVREFPSLGAAQQFLILDQGHLGRLIFAEPAVGLVVRPVPNEVWLDLPQGAPGEALKAQIAAQKGYQSALYAWDRYAELLREPLPAAVAGMLYAGFWVSLLLSLLDFSFYLAVTARRRALSFAVLRALGWNADNIWRLLAVEQATLIVPALAVGVVLGALLAYVILPFLTLFGGVALSLPLTGVIGVLAALTVGFGALVGVAAWWLRRLEINRVLRLGEE
ncbi:MAG: ABC transporter permease, partial [Anaerolineae bacterium]|nr:ABC transporter permease [Anaerolineae bacterium]